MNPFTLVDEKPYPLDMRGELDDTAAFKNFNKYNPLILMFHSVFNFEVKEIYLLLHTTRCYPIYIYCYAFRWGDIEFPLPFGRVLSPTESFIHSLDDKVFYLYLCGHYLISACNFFLSMP